MVNSLSMFRSIVFIYSLVLFFALHSRGEESLEETLFVDFWGNRLAFTQAFENLPGLTGLGGIEQYQTLTKCLNRKKATQLNNEIQRVRKTLMLDDWFYYQLLRRISQTIIAKQENYAGYTLVKQILLELSGFDARVFLSSNKILLYVKSNDTVYNIPVKKVGEIQYVCLNYHDYMNNIDFSSEKFETEIGNNGVTGTFSYTIQTIPPFPKDSTVTKHLSFYYNGKMEEYKVRINPYGKEYFKNYPVMDYRYQFSIPFSSNIEESLIAALKNRIKDMNQKQGISYLMEFTRSGFQYEADSTIYGGEKRMSPEETILSEKSDCEDRSSLMFALLTKLYMVPIIVISYPDHVNLGIGLDKPIGKGVEFNGKHYTICEPTPQKKKFRLGFMNQETFEKGFEIAFSYDPLAP